MEQALLEVGQAGDRAAADLAEGESVGAVCEVDSIEVSEESCAIGVEYDRVHVDPTPPARDDLNPQGEPVGLDYVAEGSQDLHARIEMCGIHREVEVPMLARLAASEGVHTPSASDPISNLSCVKGVENREDLGTLHSTIVADVTCCGRPGVTSAFHRSRT